VGEKPWAPPAYAGPAVRKLARQLGVNLNKVKPSGPRNRYSKEDVRSYVRDIVSRGGTGAGIPPVPAIDFAKFGEIKRIKMSKIKRSTAANMHRAWLNVPHVTQFDEADITDLENYRKERKAEAEKRGAKLTPLPFLLKACALTLQAEPGFNVSLDPDGEHIIEKHYIHIGMAVDAPGGLMVPVIRDVDKKDIWQLAEESIALASKAREGKLSPRDMQGGCFTVSSLGAMGGQGFTPVVNTPEVGILGVSKVAIKPHWDGKHFVPRTFLPLSLSYDHRAVNGATAGRFLTQLVGLLSNYREWMEGG
jgi:pyruvate dehydrogenase E2 component (dihydrolipoamide acetyltransferase)